MKNRPLISIIIPVYNVESYLNQCLESLKHQTLKDFEVILVNDGSTDNSLSICKEYSSLLPNCQIIEQKNQGVSVARNTGIQNASGNYFYFMDSDDWVDLNFIETLTNEINKADFDVFIFGFNKVNASGALINKILPRNESIIEKNKNFENLFECLNDGLGLAVWDKVIKTSIIKDNEIIFERMKNAEDFVFTIEIFSKIQSIKIIPFSPYFYRIQISGKRNDNYDLPKNHILAMDKLIRLAHGYNNESTNKFFSKTAVLWFGIVNPLNIASFTKIDFKSKIELIDMTYKWRELQKIKSRVEIKYLTKKEKLAWTIFCLNNSFVSLGFGFLLTKARKLKYN
jgi:glycosyltransferase involved in cell wall biosynthesis